MVLPQYAGENYPDIPAGQPTMDWDNLFDESAFAGLAGGVNYVPYARVRPGGEHCALATSSVCSPRHRVKCNSRNEGTRVSKVLPDDVEKAA